MKKLLLLLVLLISIAGFSQNFERNWERIYEFEREGKIKSASEEVSKIYEKARKSGNHSEIIRTFIYQSKFTHVLEEDAQFKIIKNLRKELVTSDVPTQAIFYYLYSTFLNDYQSIFRYKILQTQANDSIKHSDFRTWSYRTFDKEIRMASYKSVENEAALLATPLKKFDKIFNFSEPDKKLNRSLYDFLVEKHLQKFKYYGNLSKDETEFINQNKEALYGDTGKFVKLNLPWPENKNVLERLRYLQKLESHYLKNNDLNSLSTVVLKRLTALYDSNQNSDDVIKALKALSVQFSNTVDAPFLLKLASVYIENSTKNPDYNKFAMEICNKLIEKNEPADVTYAQVLKNSVLQKHLKVTSEKYVLPNQPNKALINFRNVDTLFATLYKVPAEFDANKTDFLGYYNNKSNDSLYLTYANNHNPHKTFELILPNQTDYNNHSTEVILPQLQIGTYLLFFNIKNEKVSENSVYSYAIIKSTELQLNTNTLQTADEFQIIHRKTGEPLKDVTLKFNDSFITTNDDGISRFNTRNDSQILRIIYGKDTLAHYFRKDNYNREYKLKGDKKVGRVSIYADRAIYRPGQTVIFKGILAQSNDDETSIVANVYLKVIAKDTKGQEFYTQRLKTNEFGSISGEFTLPKNTLNGQFQLSCEEDDASESDNLYDKKNKKHPFWDNLKYFQPSSLYFKVEEYKRPSFDVTFKPVKEAVVLNQIVTIKGKAVSFAGANLSDAKVSYSIYQYGMYDKSSRSFPTKGDDDTLITGKAKTDAEGNFEIKIMASADKGILASERPIIYYNVEATVTDINGETQKNSSLIKVGFHTLALTVNTPNEIFSNHPQDILVNSSNLNNEFTPAKGDLKIYKLKAPTRVLKYRKWETPDVKSIAPDTFQNLFPFDVYDEQQLNRNRENGALLLSKQINTGLSKNVAFPDLKNWEAGEYKVYFTAKDSLGNDIEAISFFNLVKESDNKTSDNELFQFYILNKNPEEDGFALVKMASGVPKLHVFTEATYQNESLFNKFITIDKGSKTFKIPIKKNAVGVIFIRAFITWENRNYLEEIVVNLAGQEKRDFEVKSFRSKIEPGQNEMWSFSINKNKNEQFEVLASMYDSSLDKLKESKWNSNLFHVNDYYPYLRYQVNSNNENSFNFKNFSEIKTKIISTKTEMNWFGFDFLNSNVNQYAYNLYVFQKLSGKDSNIISGRVIDDFGPLPGAKIHIVGTNKVAETDIEGFYFIKAKIGDTINISFVGYNDYTGLITNYVTNVELTDGIDIGEVLITSTLNIKRKSVSTSSTYTIAAEKISGQVAGLSINDSTNRVVFRGARSAPSGNKPLVIIDGTISSIENLEQLTATGLYDITTIKGAQGAALYGSDGVNGVIVVTTKLAVAELGNVKTRKNFNETAFFYPQIRTDKKGNFSFNFTAPEALTQWKLRLLAHDKKANSAYLEKLVVTQKELMVTPNLPRFLREKDTITIISKISNLTSEVKEGLAMLQLFDAVSMEAVDVKMLNLNSTKSFRADAKGNTSVSWKIYVPEGLQGVQYKIVAKAGNFSDGEENILPVLTNNMLVTESIPVWVRENSSKEYTFENLKNNTSTTLRNQQLTFEYTSNPTWLAIQALPYLMEYEHECAEQTFARYYANALASEILNSNPKIAEVFESWKKSEKPLSKLEQNEELKSVLLAETPWITDALSEEEKKKNLAMLFDLQKMKDSQKAILEKLTKKQKASGGFAWFDDGEESEYITRHIISGLGHLQKLSKSVTGDFDIITKNGVYYLDQKFLENHKKTEQNNKSQKLIWMYPYNNLHFLYARSFYLEKYPLTKIASSIAVKYLDDIKENWLNYSLYEKGLASLVMNRFAEKETAKKILESLRQTSSNNENWGMYWIENKSGWYWYQAPIETQALLIEAFAEIENDKKSVDAMKVWLLKNKQNKNWPTTRATTEAVYALLVQGNDWISVKDKTVIKLGDEKIMTKKLSENEKEAGTGYIKMNWKSEEITKEMATVSINNKSEVPGFGGFYWQYFEELDKIKSGQESPMTIEKELYLKTSTSQGNQLQKITTENPLKIGDLVTVRLVISTKEDMEFVHLKDMRASCFEPIDVLSKYKWQEGLGYYQSTKDVATHFFFDRIDKGKFVLEYDIRVNNTGDFSNGITTIQSMYAPEFSSHTKGIRVKIKE